MPNALIENPSTNVRYQREWTRDNPEYQREWRKSNPDKIATYNRKQQLRRYGLTPERYAEMLEEQAHGCAICGDPPAEGKILNVDHDHKSGKVRGLLCHGCNTALGAFRDDPIILHWAADYVEANRG